MTQQSPPYRTQRKHKYPCPKPLTTRSYACIKEYFLPTLYVPWMRNTTARWQLAATQVTPNAT